ncbi:hypothetical protein CIPAW_07G050500 [Carya illinoinensis]|uniref:Enoyl reductase (ER) domain-containing protein n=1 Tax=Carya illinoinensis TaxID=32201 RepID=A0A8T1PV21_CARIL|nr:hypothetical protein CIPAW_07G050500 [Carya illinoinensis]
MSKASSSATAEEKEEPIIKVYGWAARDSSGILSPFHFSRRINGDNDITIKIIYCGICHTDLALLKDESGITNYPIVPGHEIVGEVTKVGSSVKKFKIGDKAGVGCMVGSCGSCNNCKQDLENYCPKMIWTYIGYNHQDGLKTFGITIYSPMMHFGLNNPDQHLGVVGLGGLGHVAVKFAKALGMKVTVISSSPNKHKEALERLGADHFLVTSHEDQKQLLQAAMGTMDGILDTVSAPHPLLPLVNLLKTDGKLILLGAPSQPPELPHIPLMIGRKIVGGSAIGGMKETQEMMNFAAKHQITADVEVIPMDYVNTAMERLAKGDVKYRYLDVEAREVLMTRSLSCKTHRFVHCKIDVLHWDVTDVIYGM